MASKVVNYIDVDTPGIIKVNSIKKSQSLSSSNYQVTYTITMSSVAPALITSQSSIVLYAVINNSIGASRNVTVSPSIPDSASSGFYIDANGNKQSLNTFLSNLNVFPIQAIVGDVYFSIPLMTGEYFATGLLQVS